MFFCSAANQLLLRLDVFECAGEPPPRFYRFLLVLLGFFCELVNELPLLLRKALETAYLMLEVAALALLHHEPVLLSLRGRLRL